MGPMIEHDESDTLLLGSVSEHTRLPTEVIMGSRVQTRPGAQVGQPSRPYLVVAFLLGDGVEISAAVTKLAY